MNQGRKFIYLVITGILISIAISSMVQTRNGSIRQFYDDGFVVNLTENWKNASYSVGHYDVKSHRYSWQDDGDINYCFIGFSGECENLNYLEIETGNLQGTGAVWNISYIKDNAQVYKEEHPFLEGRQIIELQNIEFDALTVLLSYTEPVQYSLYSLKLTEYENQLPAYRLILGSVFVFLLLCAIYLALRKRKNVSFSIGNRVLDLWRRQSDCILGVLKHKGSSSSYASIIRIFLFICLVIGWRLYNEYGIRQYYGYIVFFQMVVFIALISWIPIEKEQGRENSLLIKLYFGLCAMQFLSELFVRKMYYGFAEIWLFLCFGLLFRAWGKMREPEILLEDFFKAMEILYCFLIVYCLTGDAWNEAGAMNGTWNNTNPFSVSVTFYLTIMLFRIYQACHGKKSIWRGIAAASGIVIGIYMLYMADCRTAWVTFGAISFLFAVTGGRCLISKFHVRGKILLFVGTGLILVAGLLFAWSRLGNLNVEYLSFNNYLSGRIVIWTAYLKEMNLLGHSNIIYLSASKLWSYAHNGIIYQMYKYGFLTGVVALMLVVETLCAAVRTWRKRTQNLYGVVIVGVILSYLLPASIESASEHPMVWINWFAFYFALSYLTQQREREV